MSKFKVGDKVWFNGDVGIIKRVDKWENDEYGYYFNINDEALNYYTEDELELYKTPHERLLELGWVLFSTIGEVYTYILVGSGNIQPEKIEIAFTGERYFTTLRVIDLELAEILVDYLKELRDE